jgi:uncharacterized protein YecE (DUF72 family)
MSEIQKSKKLHIGTSGWSYKDWVDPFYPEGTKQGDYLPYFATKFDTVEIDSTFYGTPRPATVEKWAALTPAHFLFCPKVPQEITHEKRLLNCDEQWKEFIETMKILGPKLGPVVLQFDFKFNFKEHFSILENFLDIVSKQTRLCVEIRHKSWLNNTFYDFLKQHNTALVLNDLHYMPRLTKITADFTYISFLGNRKLVPDDFSHRRIDRSKELDWWQKWIEKFLTNDLEIYAYSNNRYEGFAPGTIKDLLSRF